MDFQKYPSEDLCQHLLAQGQMTEESHNVQTLTDPVLGSEDHFSIHQTLLSTVILVHPHLHHQLEAEHHTVGL